MREGDDATKIMRGALVLALLVAVAAAVQTVRDIRFAAVSVHATGKSLGRTDPPANPGPYEVAVRFEDHEGNRRACRQSDQYVFSDTTRYGTEVVVQYDPARPDDCRVGTFFERYAVACVLWLLAILVFPLAPWCGLRFVHWVERHFG